MGNAPSGTGVIAIESAGTDPANIIGHVQGMSRVGPAPTAETDGSIAVTVGSTLGPNLPYTCDATITAVAGVCTTLNTTIASLYTTRFTHVNASIYIHDGSTRLRRSNEALNLIDYTPF